jgi:hypothetical protein
MRRVLFVLAIVVVTLLMATPPIAAEPFLKPSTATLDARNEALRVAEKASQLADWLLGNDNGNDTDKSETSETQATAS